MAEYRLRVFFALLFVQWFFLSAKATTEEFSKPAKEMLGSLYYWDGTGYIIGFVALAITGAISYAAQYVLFLGIKDK